MANFRHRHDGKDYIEAVPNAELKHKDYFHVNNYYKLVHDWLVEKGYAEMSDELFPEVFYHHRFTQTMGEEIRFEWFLKKKVNSFVTYELDLFARFTYLKNAEIVKNGVKFMTNNGEVENVIGSRVVLDPEGKFRSHWLLKMFYWVFTHRIYSGTLDWHRLNLKNETLQFREFIKESLKLVTYLPEKEGEEFFPKKDFE